MTSSSSAAAAASSFVPESIAVDIQRAVQVANESSESKLSAVDVDVDFPNLNRDDSDLTYSGSQF
jgi:hypothetical protein